MTKTIQKMPLPKLDELFKSSYEIMDEDLEKVINVKINEIDDFPKHPFKVIVNDDLNEMAESIKEKGVLSPAIVRKKKDGRYEMISGHRRKKASEIACLETIPCIVRDLSDDEATIIMVDSNLQRDKVLPSEKAFAYKLKMEALKHQGKRNDLTSSPMASKSKGIETAEIVGKEFGDCKDTVYRFLRLTELVPQLLQMVDNDCLNLTPSIAIRPAAEISYLKKEEQLALLDIIECSLCTPSLAQAIKFKKMSREGTLNVNEMKKIMSEEKPNQTPKLKVSMNLLKAVLPTSLKDDREREEYVIKAVQWYDMYLKKKRERNLQER